MRILIDTNFFIDLLRFRISLHEISTLVLEKYDLFTLDSVLNELNKIANKKTNDSQYAKLSLEFIKNNQIKILKSEGEADKVILKLADKNILVATNDRELRKMLKRKGTKTIYIKSRKHLGIE
jgi:rRNA-processing protein FCF1